MHTDLSPHLHTPECNDLISQLHLCRKAHPLRKHFGHCNTIYHQMLHCLKQERLAKRHRNFEESLARIQKICTAVEAETCKEKITTC